MTLKELRIEKGLTQSECAAYLGMTTRNYQNYENNPDKINTAKYHAIFNKLQQHYYIPTQPLLAVNENAEFRTSVITGAGLSYLTQKVETYKKRDAFEMLTKYINGDTYGKICILYGLRRTGKTTLLFQAIRELDFSKTAYIKIKTGDNMSLLAKDLDIMFKSGIRYVFIDEITLMDDFINTASILSDLYSMMGQKIVVSGTDSLGFELAGKDELYDRNLMIHTSFIPFREYSRILNIDSVDTYIEYGGTLRMENMDFSDPEIFLDEVSFRDDESTRKYIDSSISRNIQHTLKNNSFGEYFNSLRELYEAGELTNVINRIVESLNHQFLLRVVQERFKSSDLGSARELLLHDVPKSEAHILYDVDEATILERLKKIIDVKEKSELGIEITNVHIEKIKKYLYMLDLIVNCKEIYEGKGTGEHIVFSQPGMRYSIAKALIYSLKQDQYFSSVSEEGKRYIITKILEDVKGRMLEDIVLLETYKAASKKCDVFKFKFDNGAEFDMVVYDSDSNTCRIYEVKHSEKIAKNQTRYLNDTSLTCVIEKLFGKITGKYVIYRGPAEDAFGVTYLNAEEYLKTL